MPRRHLARRSLAAGLAALALGLASCSAGTDDTAGSPSDSSPTPPSTSTSPTVSPDLEGLPRVIPANSCRLRVDAMDPQERAGQLVMVGHQIGEDPAGTGRLVAEHDLGAVILMGTTDAGVASVREMTDALREASGADRDGLVVAVDQEGGQVLRLSGDGFTAMPAPIDQAALSDQELAAAARTWGAELREAGIDVDLAPVADVVPADRVAVNEPVARWGRGYGSDRAAVAADVTAFVSGLREGGTGTAIKHFPGLGQVVDNTDFATDVADDRTTRDDPLLEPFAAGIAAGTDMVLVSSARYTRIDPDNPAIWSATVIEDMLRGDLGWQGVVVSDDLGVAEQVQAVDPGERAVRFVEAGGDIAITVDPALAGDMATAIAEGAEQDPAFDQQVRAAALRVLELKAERGLAGCAAG